LRREGYRGPVFLIGDEDPGPVDRPNLSKDYLAGTAPEEWVPLRTREFYAEQGIDFLLGDPVVTLDLGAQSVRLKSGRALAFGALLLATGAEPITLPIPGATLPRVHKLRTLADSRAIIAASAGAKRAVIIGASFIGLEVAASLRQRGLEVTVVGPELVPLGRVLGDDVGRYVQSVHEQHGVVFRLGRKPVAIADAAVTLDDESSLPAGLVVMGVGVRPRTALAEAAGLTVDNGIVVDEQLRTSAPNVYGAGDVARFSYRGARVRIEHFAVAVRQGQAAARSMLGRGEVLRDVPFFWSQHHDLTISYVGHADGFDQVEIKGSLEARDACIVYRAGGSVRAVATIGRDKLGLMVERALENDDADALEELLRRTEH
jgi:NADPH-dependent 2,4-dienoyl-CoA reductase/sulfur reductase-like enzyme